MPRPILYLAKHVYTIPETKHLENKWIIGFLTDETHIYNPTLQKELLIDPETISQFTGKFDDTKWDDLPSEMQQKVNKSTWKGIPIYENDIVLTTYTDNSSEEVTVTYDTDYAGFTPWVWQYECYDCKSKVKIKSVKSIGNRFDNERRVL